MAYDSASLCTPDIKWLGVRPSDLDRFRIPEQCRLDMTDKVRVCEPSHKRAGEEGLASSTSQ
jgi:hypothetical protein